MAEVFEFKLGERLGMLKPKHQAKFGVCKSIGTGFESRMSVFFYILNDSIL